MTNTCFNPLNVPPEDALREECQEHIAGTRNPRDLLRWLQSIECPYRRQHTVRIFREEWRLALLSNDTFLYEDSDGRQMSVWPSVDEDLQQISREAIRRQHAYEAALCPKTDALISRIRKAVETTTPAPKHKNQYATKTNQAIAMAENQVATWSEKQVATWSEKQASFPLGNDWQSHATWSEKQITTWSEKQITTNTPNNTTTMNTQNENTPLQTTDFSQSPVINFYGGTYIAKVEAGAVGNVENGGIGIQHVQSVRSVAPATAPVRPEQEGHAGPLDGQQNLPCGSGSPVAPATTPVRPEQEGHKFAYIVRAGHTEKQIEEVLEKIRISAASGKGSDLLKLLFQMEKEGFLYLGEARAAEIYTELSRSFDMSLITRTSIQRAYSRYA